MKNFSVKNLLSNAFFGLPVVVLFLCFTSMGFTSGVAVLPDMENCPTASFSASNSGCIAPCAITFTNHSQNATSYLWDFGDGNTSAALNPSHSYILPGSYTVKLIAYGDGCEAVSIIIVDTIDM